MIPTCDISGLKIYRPSDYTRRLAGELSCPPLAAGVLEMLKGGEDIDTLREWIHPDFTKQIETLAFTHAPAHIGQGSSVT